MLEVYLMQEEQKKTIKELADLLNELNLTEIEYDVNGVHLRVVGTAGARSASVPTTVAPTTPVENALPSTVKPAKQICSPMVGVAYLTKDENSPAFVKVGDRVSIGQTVCLIEAMKTFNPIKADKAGIITEILIESGSPVEYNQPLFNVE